MDQLDSLGQSGKGINLVMDNCRIHHGPAVQELCIASGYNIVFLPPYSPFLNPIEEFWSKLKLVYRRDKLDDGSKDGVVHRVNEAVSKITVEDLVAWINHSLTFFQRCVDEEDL